VAYIFVLWCCRMFLRDSFVLRCTFCFRQTYCKRTRTMPNDLHVICFLFVCMKFEISIVPTTNFPTFMIFIYFESIYSLLALLILTSTCTVFGFLKKKFNVKLVWHFSRMNIFKKMWHTFLCFDVALFISVTRSYYAADVFSTSVPQTYQNHAVTTCMLCMFASVCINLEISFGTIWYVFVINRAYSAHFVFNTRTANVPEPCRNYVHVVCFSLFARSLKSQSFQKQIVNIFNLFRIYSILALLILTSTCTVFGIFKKIDFNAQLVS